MENIARKMQLDTLPLNDLPRMTYLTPVLREPMVYFACSLVVQIQAYHAVSILFSLEAKFRSL